jgi:peptide/nickel transport system permease protein
VQSLFLVHPWLSIVPGLTIVLLVIALNIAGDGLRDAIDPRLRRQGMNHGAG